MDEDVIIRFDGEDDLTPKLDNIEAGFKRVTDAVDYLAELAASDAEAIDKLGSSLAAVGETAVPALTNLHNTFLILGLDIAQVDAQTNALIAKNGELASSYTDLVASEKEQQVAMLTGLETQTLLQSHMGAALPVLEQTSQLYADMQAQSNAYMRSLGQLADVTTLSADATRTLSDGTVVARESLQTAGGAALLAANQTRVYDESLRGVDVTLQQTASEQRVAAEALAQFQAELSQGSNALTTMTEKEQADAEAAYLLAEKLGLVADGSTQANTALRFSLVELESLTNAFKSSAVSVQEFIAAGYNIKDINAGLQVLIETGDASAAAMKVLTSEMGQFSAVAVPALLDVHNTFNILGQDITRASVETNELIAKNAELAGSYVGLTKAEQEQQLAMLVGLQTQNEARMGVVEVGDALAMTTAEQLKLGEATLASMTNMYAQGLAAGEDADKMAALRMQITETAAQMDTLAASERTAADAGGGESGGFGMSSFLLFTLGMMALGAGRQFLSMGIDVEHSLNVIQLATNSTDEQMQTWKSTLESLGNTWGVQMPQMVASLDLVTRAQFRATDATDVLTAAATFANHTNNEMVGSTDLLTTALKAYGAGADQASSFAGTLETTWDNSRMSLGELSSLMGNTLPVAAGLGISFADLGNAVAVFSQSTASGMIATRDFQAMLAGLQNFSILDSAAIEKLAGSFDIAKFAALDVTGKFLNLAKAADGNVSAFQGFLGGANNATDAMNRMDISTAQLSKNAMALGVPFDDLKFNSLDAAGKLLYLAGIVDFNETRFKKLTDTIVPTNVALANLRGPVDAAGQRLEALGKNFDMTAFKSDDLSQKLHDLYDFMGGPTPEFIKAIGGAKNLQEAYRIMGQEVDQHHEAKIDTGPAQTNIKDASDKLDALHRKIDEVHHIPAIPPVDTKPIDDVSLALGRLKTAVSNAAVSLETVLAPALVVGLNGMASALNLFASGTWNNLWNHLGMEAEINIVQNLTKVRDYIQGGFKGSTVAALADVVKAWPTTMQNLGADFQMRFTMAGQHLDDYIRGGFKGSVVGALGDAVKAFPQTMQNLGADFQIRFTTAAQHLHDYITGGFKGSIVGSLVDAVTAFPKTMQNLGADFQIQFAAAAQKLHDYITGGFKGSVVGAIEDMVKAITKALTTTDWADAVKKSLDAVKKWFEWLSQQLVGGSIVPDMVSAITRVLTQGGIDWLTPITTFISTAESDFNTASTTLSAIAGEIGANINSAFVTAGATWNATVGSAMSTVVATVQSWVGAAMSAGAAVGNAIGDGIESAVGWIKTAAGDAASAIAGIFQHLSPPKEGPLHTDDQWMPNMVKMMASGITDNTGTLRQAAITAATSITVPLQSVSQTQLVQSIGNTGNTATDMTPVVQILVQIYQVLRTQQMQGSSTGGQSPVRGNVSQQQMLASLYQMLNGYGGFTFESGARGAYAGLGV